jgi:hypothetical protein
MKKYLFLLVSFPLFVWGNLQTHIHFTGDPRVSVRTVLHTFHTLGYRFDIHSLSVSPEGGEIIGTAIGNRPFQPSAFVETLKNQKIRIDKSSMEKSRMTLTLDTRDAFWDVPSITEEDGASLKRANTPQWFRISGTRNIRIEPPYGGKWYPEIAILNSDMEVLSSSRSAEAKEEMFIELPAESYYLKVSNTQGMKLLKEGMWIESLNREP